MKNNFKSFDMGFLKKMASPHAADDLNKFLEKLPQNTNQTLLIMTGIAWAAAGALGLFTTLKMQAFTELRAELQEMKAIKPSVPSIRDKSVSRDQITLFVQKNEKTYGNLKWKASGSNINIYADNTAYYGQFREAIGHVQNGGDGWRVTIDKLCVGRECGRKPLEASLKINKIEVREPS